MREKVHMYSSHLFFFCELQVFVLCLVGRGNKQYERCQTFDGLLILLKGCSIRGCNQGGRQRGNGNSGAGTEGRRERRLERQAGPEL